MAGTAEVISELGLPPERLNDLLAAILEDAPPAAGKQAMQFLKSAFSAS